MPDLTHYTPEHRHELESLLRSPEWTSVLSSGLVEEVRAERIEPGTVRGFIDTVVDQLLEFNRERVEALIGGTCRDEARLLDALSEWPEGLDGRDLALSFVGLNVTAECNARPRCAYCNQPYVASSVDLAGWKAILAEATAGCDGQGPYVYITGGEPLTLGEAIWGDEGLVRFATERGAGVNVNTNGALLTPETALRLIKAGLAKLHVSLDSPDADVQDGLRGAESFDAIVRGIYNVQLARDIIGVAYPVIHTNCVLTEKNLDAFPQLFAFILDKHKQTVDKEDPFRNDLFPHVIPVGGAGNEGLRPSEDGFRRFYEEVWQEVCTIWDEYQAGFGVAVEDRGELFGFFTNPFLRVAHKGGLDAYVKASAQGRYGRLALSQHCYVAPTQASFTPDGLQYRCGSHGVRRILPIGRAGESGVFESIRAGTSGLAELPQEEHCYGCALATLYINQSVESKLQETVAAMLGEGEQDGASPREPATDN